LRHSVYNVLYIAVMHSIGTDVDSHVYSHYTLMPRYAVLPKQQLDNIKHRGKNKKYNNNMI